VRTLSEIIRAAYAIRNRFLERQLDPRHGVILCTPEEAAMIDDTAYVMARELPDGDPAQVTRLCGLRVIVMDGKAPCGHDPLSVGSTMEMREPRLFRCVVCGLVRELL
jgi:hypothetical protein